MMPGKKAPAARRSKAGRRRPTAATVRLSVSLESDLLKRAEAFATARRTTVPALVAEALRKVIGAEKAPAQPSREVQSNPDSESGWAQLLAWMEEQQTTLTEIRNQLGDVAASLPNDAPPDSGRSSRTKIPPP